jgi:hypothetical protein
MKKETLSTLFYIFFAAAVILLICRVYLLSKNQNEEVSTVQWFSPGFLLAALLYWVIPGFFPKNFGAKPTREEIEKRFHGE